MNTSGLTRGAALTIPVKSAWQIADSLAKHGSVKRGYLGVRTQAVELPESAQKALKRVQARGLRSLGLPGLRIADPKIDLVGGIS